MLPGLLAKHPAAAMATFGLYEAIPGCKISFKVYRNSHVPVLHSPIPDAYELARVLATPETWDFLPLADLLPVGNLKITKAQKAGKRLKIAEYQKLQKVCPRFAAAMGTDQVIVYEAEKDEEDKKKKGQLYPVAACTPYLDGVLCRHDSLAKTILAHRDAVLNTGPEEICHILTSPVWRYRTDLKAPNLGLFPEDPIDLVFKGEAGVVRKLPLLCLLALASLYNLPCYFDGKTVAAPGRTDEVVYYPVFSRPFAANEFASLMMHPGLPVPKNREAWARYGVIAVYQAAIRRTKKGPKTVESLYMSTII